MMNKLFTQEEVNQIVAHERRHGRERVSKVYVIFLTSFQLPESDYTESPKATRLSLGDAKRLCEKTFHDVQLDWNEENEKHVTATTYKDNSEILGVLIKEFETESEFI